jgi:hypothetical protein
MFLRNVCIYLQVHTALQPRTPTSTSSPPWERNKSHIGTQQLQVCDDGVWISTTANCAAIENSSAWWAHRRRIPLSPALRRMTDPIQFPKRRVRNKLKRLWTMSNAMQIGTGIFVVKPVCSISILRITQNALRANNWVSEPHFFYQVD